MCQPDIQIDWEFTRRVAGECAQWLAHGSRRHFCNRSSVHHPLNMSSWAHHLRLLFASSSHSVTGAKTTLSARNLCCRRQMWENSLCCSFCQFKNSTKRPRVPCQFETKRKNRRRFWIAQRRRNNKFPLVDTYKELNGISKFLTLEGDDVIFSDFFDCAF